MKGKIEKLKAYMKASDDFTDLIFINEAWITGSFKGIYFELSRLSTDKPAVYVSISESLLSEILLHFGIIETNRFKNTKVTHRSLNLLAKIVRKSFDEKQNTKERGQEIVDLAFQLELPNAEQMKIDHENNIYVPWI